MKAAVGKNNETTHTGTASKPAGATVFFQPKLTVNTPGDAYEQEADRVADQVMRMRDGDTPIVQRMALTPVNAVQRRCAECEKEDEERVQRKETGGGQAAPAIVSGVLASGGGRPLDAGARQFMESRFGQDFGQVRIHTDGKAAESAAAIQARAYTSGRDIVFGKEEYRPESAEGRRLLAHELVHVGQQGKTTSRAVQRSLFGSVLGGIIGGVGLGLIGGLVGGLLGGPVGALIGAGIGALAGGIGGALIGNALGCRQEAPANEPHLVGLANLPCDNISESALENTSAYQAYMAPGSEWQTTHHVTAAEARLACLVLLDQIRQGQSISWTTHALQAVQTARGRVTGIENNQAQTRLSTEIGEVPLASAQRIFTEMQTLFFRDTFGQNRPVPYHYPPDGCYARAEMMSARLTALGYASEKKFALSGNRLAVPTDYSADAPSGATPTTTWRYHVAPIIKVRINRDVVDYVIDPSIASGPVPVSTWTGMMSQATFTDLSLSDLRARMTAYGATDVFRTLPRSGPDSNITYSTGRSAYGPNDINGGTSSAQDRLNEAVGTLTEYSIYAEAHELAHLIRTELRGPSVQYANIVQRLNSMRREGIEYYRDNFTQLTLELQSRLSNQDYLDFIQRLQ